MESLERHSDQPAIDDGLHLISYAELQARAEKVATAIAHSSGLVAAMLPRGSAAIVYTVAAIMTGRPFVHLDPALPRFAIGRLNSSIAPTGIALPARAGEIEIRPTKYGAKPSDVTESCAYLTTTSGSTGEPKIICGSGTGLAHYLDWHRTEFSLGPGDVCSHIAAPWFDFSFKETLAALAAGACVTIAPVRALASGRSLAQWLARARPSVTCLLPSQLSSLVNAVDPDTATGLRHLLISGEPLRPGLVRRWRDRIPEGPMLTNLYGPAEATVIKTYYRIPDDGIATLSVPVGVAIPGARVELQPITGSEDGRIGIRSPHLALGYLAGDGGSTRFEVTEAGRALWTGDLGRFTLDGDLEVVGRIDGAVKRHGVLIVPHRLENALMAHPAIDEAVMAATTDDVPRIGLFYIRRPDLDEPSLAELRGHLLDTITAAEMPSALIETTAFPVTTRGKVDRRALARRMTTPPRA